MAGKHTTWRDGRRLLWHAERLWKLANDLEPFEIEISKIKEFDQNCWFDSREPTLREVTRHVARIEAADLAYPIILNDDGSLMDGGHRVCKAHLDGRLTIKAVQFVEMPTPDEVLENEKP